MRFRESGFTLPELAVTLGVLAILVALAAPSFTRAINSNRVTTAVNELTASVGLARSEAIRSTRGASLCASADGASCGSDWNAGWMIWTDTNGDGSAESGEVLRYVQAKKGMSIEGPSAPISFDSRGRAANGRVVITLQAENCLSQPLRRTMTISAAGQLQKGALENCQ